MEALNDLELLIDSRYPIIAVETVEEGRVERTLLRVAARLEVPLFVWSVTRGLVRRGSDAPVYDTVEPVKAVAKNWGMPLLRMEPGRLYDKYIGESDKNLARALATAERMAPCVLMIDEIEKGFAAVGSADADAGLSRRIFGRLLGWLQDREAPVFVVATCNRIADLPPELMRKGRFDEIFFVDLPDAGERREIFRVHLAKRDRDPGDFDLDSLVEATEGFSGAEIEQAIVSALYTAFSEGTSLTDRHVLGEVESTRPLSVTRAEQVTALREWARGRTVMAG